MQAEAVKAGNDEVAGLRGNTDITVQEAEAAGRVVVRVLVVEDDPVNRAIVKQLLQGCGYDVVEACDGREAIRLLSRGNASNVFSLVLCDIVMPNIDGKGVLSFIRGTNELKNLPVVMMSALEQTPTVFDCIKRGADDYILKPVTRKEVKYLWQHVWRRKNSVIRNVDQDDHHKKSGELTPRANSFAPATLADEAAANEHYPDAKTLRPGPFKKGEQIHEEMFKRKRNEFDPKMETEVYNPAEMREYCERQIKKYERVIKLIDENPQLFR